jgi:hypothetical protein
MKLREEGVKSLHMPESAEQRSRKYDSQSDRLHEPFDCSARVHAVPPVDRGDIGHGRNL